MPDASRALAMKPAAKLGLVAAGYAAALVIAFVAVRAYVALSSGPDRVASSGMSAFGDGLLFLAAFGLAAIPATGLGLYFLRPLPGVWTALSIAALVVAASSIVACLIHLTSSAAAPGPPVSNWSVLATLRILVAPLCALVFLLSGLLAPAPKPRLMLLASSVIEAVAFAAVAVTWIYPLR